MFILNEVKDISDSPDAEDGLTVAGLHHPGIGLMDICCNYTCFIDVTDLTGMKVQAWAMATCTFVIMAMVIIGNGSGDLKSEIII